MEVSARILVSSTTRLACYVLRMIWVLAVINSVKSRELLASTVPDKFTQMNDEWNSMKTREHFASKETKRQMLNVLGMDELPKPRQGIIPHQYMMYIYEKMSRRKPAQNGVNTIRGFVDVGNDDSSARVKFHQIYAFNISALPRSEKIISADLRLLRLPTGLEWRYAWAHGMQYRAKLYYRRPVIHVWKGQVFTHTELIFLDSVLFDIRTLNEHMHWKVFKVLRVLREWQNDTNFVHDLELQVESVRTGYLMPTFAFGLTEKGRPHYKRALLVSFTDDGKERLPEESENEIEAKPLKRSKGKKVRQKTEEEKKYRVKRSTKRRRRRKPLCSRRTLYVDFALLGWSEWIIAPRGYNAYFCQGICKYPIPEHLKPTNHAMVQTTVHYNDRRRVPAACCVPHKLSGLSMLFMDKGDSVVYKKYDNMVVESCGCK